MFDACTRSVKNDLKWNNVGLPKVNRLHWVLLLWFWNCHEYIYQRVTQNSLGKFFVVVRGLRSETWKSCGWGCDWNPVNTNMTSDPFMWPLHVCQTLQAREAGHLITTLYKEIVSSGDIVLTEFCFLQQKLFFLICARRKLLLQLKLFRWFDTSCVFPSLTNELHW